MLDPLPPPSFLTDDICKRVTTYHIRATLGDAIARGQRTGYVTIPITFDNDNSPSNVLLYYTTNKGKWVQQLRPLSDVKPARPPSANVEVIVLDGAHKGCIANVTKLMKKKGMVDLRSDDGEVWQESLGDVCLLNPHTDSGCDCQRQMSSD